MGSSLEMTLTPHKKHSGDNNLVIIVFNHEYQGQDNLEGAKQDGALLRDLYKNQNFVLESMENIKNFETMLRKLKRKYKCTQFENLHFHFSGHGVQNAKIDLEINPDEDGDYNTNTPTGDCIVGVSNILYLIHDLKHALLRFNTSRVLITLDCCRNQRRTKGRSSTPKKVKLKEKLKIKLQDQERLAVFFGQLDGHTSSDANSFTKELCEVINESEDSIPIGKIAKTVNESWIGRKINQRCHATIVYGECNWDEYIPITKQVAVQGEGLQGEEVKQKQEENVVKVMQSLHQETKKDMMNINENVQLIRTDVDKLDRNVRNITTDVNKLKRTRKAAEKSPERFKKRKTM